MVDTYDLQLTTIKVTIRSLRKQIAAYRKQGMTDKVKETATRLKKEEHSLWSLSNMLTTPLRHGEQPK